MGDINSNVKMYVITHVPCNFVESEIFIPVATNKALGDQLGIMSSDQGINRGQQNSLLAEYSTFYWAWKNDKTSRYIGFNHFRRYLIPSGKGAYTPGVDSLESCGWTKDYIENLFNEYDLILPFPLNFGGVNVYQQYCYCHEQPIITALIDVIGRKYPHMAEAFVGGLNNTFGYYCNLFIMRWEDFDKYMEFAFDLFQELMPVLVTSHQAKPFAYIGERIFCGYVEYLKREKGFKVKEVPTHFC